MIWLTSLSLLLVLFSENQATDGRLDYGSSSPWTDHTKASNFMTCLVQDITNSPVFPAQEKQDLESTVETMMSAISSVSSSSGRAQIQAMEIAFASSLAEVVIADDVDNQQAVSTKTSALFSSLQNCFRSTYGFVYKRFITEMQDMINILTQEANDEANEIDTDQYSITGAAGNDLAAYYGASTAGSSAAWTSTSFGTSTTAAPSYGSPGGSSASFGTSASATASSAASATTSTTTTSAATQPASQPSPSAFGASSPTFGTSSSALYQSLSSALSYSLSSSTIFQSIFGSGLSSQILLQITVSASQSALSQLGLSSVQVSSYSSAIQTALLSLGYGASPNEYANAISTVLASGLQSDGILNSSNVNSIASSLSAAYSQYFTSVASQYGIQVSQSAATAGSATSASTSTSTTSSATQSASQSAAYQPASQPAAYQPASQPAAYQPASQPAAYQPASQPAAYQPAIQSAASAFGASSATFGTSASALSQSSSSVFSSSQGLTSPAAISRIQGLAQSLLQAFGPNGFQVNSLSQGLSSSYSLLVNSGLSSQQAQVEALLEAVVALVQILSSAQIGSVNFASTSATSQSVASSVIAAFG